MEEKHVIVLGDGTKIWCELNGNNYLPNTHVEDALLEDVNLIGMIIDGVEQNDMTCCNHWVDADGEHIVFRPYTEQEKMMQGINAKLEYLAMMGDVEL